MADVDAVKHLELYTHQEHEVDLRVAQREEKR
jgi:hypothetical protein